MATENAEKNVKLTGFFGLKLGMASVFDEQGKMVPVTLIQVPHWIVSQIKTNEKDGYSSVQIASVPKKSKNSPKSESSHLKKAGFESGARYVREIRQKSTEGVEVGQSVSLESIQTGDLVRLTGISKGHGFAGVVRRWGFAGGPATHGSGFHRRPGSVGNRTWPGRVMPGKKFPGHYGCDKTTIPRVKVIGMDLEERVLLVKGQVPGPVSGLVQVMKV